MKEIINSKNIKQNSSFPYLVLKVHGQVGFPHNPGFLVMHWHEDLQLIYGLADKVQVRFLANKSLNLTAGEGLFINKKVAHQVLPSDQAKYYSFIFPDYFLLFYLNSPVGKIINKFVNNSALSFYLFSKHIKWQKQIIEQLQKLVTLEQKKNDPLYAYGVLLGLSQIFFLMIKNVKLKSRRRVDNVNFQRMHVFLAFIQDHYSEKISLKMIADSAHVSKSECLRTFHLLLNTTPWDYLMDFRLNQAANLLRNSSLTVTDIAHQVGLNQASHFVLLFKRKTGFTPREYRQQKYY